jgi:glutamyl-tRNA synthetase
MASTSRKVVTRFPPSPTGFLHIGSLRTALYNYLLARKHDGTFIVRVEDTDRERLVEGAVESLVRTLDDIGLDYDEGPILIDGQLSQKGSNGPYTQSARLEIYREHIDRLINAGNAYHCFCTKERLDTIRKQQQLAKLPTKYDRTCADLDPDNVAERVRAGESHVIRMRVQEGVTVFEDAVRGTVKIDNSEVDDQVLMKSDGFPTYHLAVVVDDNAMGVTHVIRGEEWISSVPKHIMLYRWFDFPLPVFAHLPLILNPDKSKLSKRQGDVAVEDYLSKGYLPEALLNYVALLGFNPSGDREVYSLQELKDGFELSKINKSGAIFDRVKMDWMNSQYIKKLSIDELEHRAKPFVSDAWEGTDVRKVLSVEQDRLVRLDELAKSIQTYKELPDYDAELLIWKKSDREDAIAQLRAIRTVIENLSSFEDLALIETDITRYIKDNGLQNGNVLWPLRVALSGRSASPGPFELLWVLGKTESLSRVDQSIANLQHDDF